MSLIALFVALGGSAYATGVLPPNSIGRSQLQENAVTASKLAPNSVGRSELRPESVTAADLALGSVGWHALSPVLRARLSRRAVAGSSGAQGPAGPAGPAGAQGPSGPGAIRLHYAADGTTSPTPERAVDIGGLHLDAQCQDGDSGTQLNLSATTDEPATIMENINVDNGPGLASFATANSANLQIALPAGTTVLGGPSTGKNEYARIFARLLYVTSDKTVELTIVLLLDGTADTCAIDGVGVPAAS